MKSTIIFILFILGWSSAANAQLYATKNGSIKIFSDAPQEKIEAINLQVNAALNADKGDLVFRVLMKSFEFKNALTQEHFNETYVESDKFPSSTFVGKVTNIKEINFSKDGNYDALIEGKLTLHGVTKVIKEKGTFEVIQGKIVGKSNFRVLLSDYNINNPNSVEDNIPKTLEINVEIALEKIYN